MKLTLVIFAATLLTAAPVLAQVQAEKTKPKSPVAEMCAHTKCQHNLRINLKDKDGGTFDRTFQVFPAAVQPLGIVVAAGQTVHIEADVVDGRLTNLVHVDAIANPHKTITAKFEQIDGKAMMLTVSNPFKQALKFNMGIMPLDQTRLVKTSSCPIVAGGKAFETWPYPIFQVALGKGRLLPEDSKVACDD